MKALLALLALISGVACAQTLTMSPNTSATSTTGAFSNGTLSGQTNISQGTGIYNVHSLLYSGHTTKVLVHYLPWFDGGNDGDSSHPINVNYSNADSTYVNKFYTDLVARGVDGVIVDYQGATDITGTSWAATASIIHSYSSLKFAMMLDANLLGTTSGANSTAKVLSAMSSISSYLSDSSYLNYGGNPVVFDFGLTSSDVATTYGSAVNWATVQAAYPSVQFVHEDDATGNGFSVTDSAGSFSWIHANESSLGTAPNLSYLDTFYQNFITNYSTAIGVGSVFKGFNPNPYAPWDSPVRYTDQQCGQTWLNSWGKINSNFSTTHQLPFVQLVTWDDYFEGTTLETGIDSCLAPTITQSGSLPSKTITIDYHGVTTSTQAEVQLWGYYSGAWHYVTYPAGTTSFTITGANTYWIKFVGKPFIANILSASFLVN